MASSTLLFAESSAALPTSAEVPKKAAETTEAATMP